MLYKTKDKPPVPKLLLAAFQQLLAVLAGTVAVPLVVGNGMSQSAALLGAGIGTIIYLVITKFRCPVFLGSSFSFVGSMSAAFAGAISMAAGYTGIVIGALLAGLIYVILSIVVKFAGTKWIDKIMPPVIIGPTVAIIGLVLAPKAIEMLFTGGLVIETTHSYHPYICMICGLVALFASAATAVYAKGIVKLVPFIIGILAGYIIALIFTLVGLAMDVPDIQIVDLSVFNDIKWLPDIAVVNAIEGFRDFSSAAQFFEYFALIAFAFIPVSFVCFAEHIADHKNLGFIVGDDYLTDPGLHRTLMGDGVGSMTGALLGGIPNTTYGESISCVAFSKNASVWVILAASIMAIGLSFVGPLMAFFASIPPCVVGGISIVLYGFIAASGLRMLKDVDLTDIKNIFIVSSIFVAGVGGMVIQFFTVVISPIASALIVGVLMNFALNIKRKKKDNPSN